MDLLRGQWTYRRVDNNLSASTRHSPIVGSILGQRRWRWPNIDPTMGECLFFSVVFNFHQVSSHEWCSGVRQRTDERTGISCLLSCGVTLSAAGVAGQLHDLRLWHETPRPLHKIVSSIQQINWTFYFCITSVTQMQKVYFLYRIGGVFSTLF